MTKEIELVAEVGAKARYPQTDYMTFLDIVNSDTDRLIYETGFKDCAQWMATRNRWVSVDERLPEPENRTIISKSFIVYGIWTDPFSNLKGMPYCDTCRFFYASKRWSESKRINITHWQELPSPPQEK